jgi:hypothetical protein
VGVDRAVDTPHSNDKSIKETIMGNITINFVGICTHLPAVGPSHLHRVVVIQNPAGNTIGGNPISPHTASIKIVKGDIVSGTVPSDLSRRRLTISNAVSGNVTYDPTWGAIPTLSRFAGAPLTLNAAVAFDGTPPSDILVTYFDIFSGSFLAGWVPSMQTPIASRQPVGASVTIQTSADNPTLLFDGSSPVEVTFTPGTILELINDANEDAPDQDFDFLLHFEIVSPIPPSPIFPMQIQFTGLQNLPGLKDGHDITTGCSNSAYP